MNGRGSSADCAGNPKRIAGYVMYAIECWTMMNVNSIPTYNLQHTAINTEATEKLTETYNRECVGPGRPNSRPSNP